MRNSHTALGDVFVVDPRPCDYRTLARALRRAFRFRFATTGEAALRQATPGVACHWLVAAALPDASGFDLLPVLRSLPQTLSVALVDETYSLSSEKRARLAGAAFYLCKPLDPEWFAQICGRPVSALRARREINDRIESKRQGASPMPLTLTKIFC